MFETLEKILTGLGLLSKETSCNSSVGLKIRKEQFARETFASILPFETFDPETGLFFSSKSMGFALEARPMLGADESSQKEFTSLFQDVMEEGSNIQCLLWADPRLENFLGHWTQPRKAGKQVYHHLAQKRAAFTKDLLNGGTRNFRFILSYSVPAGPETTPVHLEELKRQKEKISRIIELFSPVKSLEVGDFLSILDGLVNLDSREDSGPFQWNELEMLSSQVPRGGPVQVREDGLVWKGEENTLFKSFRASKFPDRWSMASMQRLIGDFYRESYRINQPFYIHYGVHCPIQKHAQSSLWRRTQLVENQARSSFLLRVCPDLGSEAAECDFVRRSVHSGQKIVQTQLSVGLWAKQSLFSAAEQSLKTLFRANQFDLSECTCVHLPQFLACLPMAWGEYVEDLRSLNSLKMTLSSECGNLIPNQAEWSGTSSPGMLFLGRRGQICNWNPFDNQTGNYNCVVVGRSGSGKSVFMQDMLVSGLGVGARVFVLEVGRSFQKLCQLVGGQFVHFGSETHLCLNPFSLISDRDSEARDSSFSMLKSIIASMAAPTDGTGDLENALIEKAIRFAWDSKGRNARISDVARWLNQQSNALAVSLGTMLTPYTDEGVYARYFEGDNNVNFTDPMVLIELEELKSKKDLQSVVLQLCMMNITNQVFLGDRKTPFYICVDEAWDLLRGKQTGEFIETLARRLRKYRGSLVIGTQSVDDFFATPGALAAFENSDWMCLLSQKKSSIKRFAESGKIDLDEAKLAALESVQTVHGRYSEIMVMDADGGSAIVRLQLDPFSNLLYSTKAEEFSQIQDLQNQGLSTFEAIERVLQGKGMVS